MVGPKRLLIPLLLLIQGTSRLKLLRFHTKWAQFFENLRYIVIDEVHTYRGARKSPFRISMPQRKTRKRHNTRALVPVTLPPYERAVIGDKLKSRGSQ